MGKEVTDEDRETGARFWTFYEAYHGHPYEKEFGEFIGAVNKRVIEAGIVFLIKELKND